MRVTGAVAVLAMLAMTQLVGLPAAWAQASKAGQATPPTETARARERQQRVAERLAEIGKQADALVEEERSLLAQLRDLESERASRQQAVTEAERAVTVVEAELEALTAEVAALEARVERERPLIERRMVALYKRGRLETTRLLIDLPKARDMARAYRTSQAVVELDQRRFRAYQTDRQVLVAKGQRLAERGAASERARAEAIATQAALARAVRRHADAIAVIDARRDLSARLAHELAEANRQLDRAVAGLETSTPAPLPVEAFKGAFDWPVRGAVLERFGPSRQRYGTATPHNGITVSAGAGSSVKAVHEGRVAFAAPFAGFGLLVIVDHGGQDYSLYGYLDATAVTKGDLVEAGTEVGRSGTSPRGMPGLYFELRVDGSPVNPVEWLARSKS